MNSYHVNGLHHRWGLGCTQSGSIHRTLWGEEKSFRFHTGNSLLHFHLTDFMQVSVAPITHTNILGMHWYHFIYLFFLFPDSVHVFWYSSIPIRKWVTSSIRHVKGHSLAALGTVQCSAAFHLEKQFWAAVSKVRFCFRRIGIFHC